MPKMFAIHLKTNDVRATADWYMKLGLPKRNENESDGSRTITLDAGGFPLVITQHPYADTMPGVPLSQFLGIEHFGFAVEDLDAQLKRLRREGVAILEGSTLDEKGKRVAFVRAPDNVRLELTDYVQW